jgi:hypothetical protein
VPRECLVQREVARALVAAALQLDNLEHAYVPAGK